MNEKNIPKIIYIGSDLSYWKALSAKFGELVQSTAFEAIHLYEDTGSELQKLISVVRSHKPKMVFVDFSQNTSQMLHIVRVLTRLNGIFKPFVVGLVDQSQGDVAPQRAVLAGATCVHIKSVELSSVVYNCMCYVYPDKATPHGFATAELSDPISAKIPCMVSILSPDGIRIESNLSLTIGESYSLHTRWSDKKIVKTPSVQCGSSTDEDLYYNYKYTQELGFNFVEEDESTEELSEEEIVNIEQLKAQEAEQSKNLLSKWIESNQEFSHPKSLKTLVIDKELQFYQGDKLTDEFPFVLRCQPYLQNPKMDIKRIYPQLIVFNTEEISPEELEANEEIAFTFNDFKALKNIVTQVKTISNYEPYIIIFNMHAYNTAKLQGHLGYKNLIAYSEAMTSELVLKMSSMLEEKLLENVVTYDDDTIFLKKDHPATYAELEIDVDLRAVSENDLYFDCDIDLPLRTVLRISNPVNMYIAIAPAPNSAKSSSKYYAVIHTIGEVERAELRQFINSVFFRKLEEKKSAEREEVENLKQQVIEKKQVEQQKAVDQQKEEKENKKEQEKEEQQKRDKTLQEDI